MTKRLSYFFPVALLSSYPAQSQSLSNGSLSTGSPSYGAATVSPATVIQAADQYGPVIQDISVSLGSSYASGNFGAGADANIWNTTIGVRYATGPLRITASIPYMRIRSNGTVFTGIDSTPIIISSSQRGRTRSDGFGDITVGTSYTQSLEGSVDVEFAGRVKFPVATRSSGLSSGKADYAGAMQISKNAGKLAPFMSIGYRILGDPKDIDLRNGIAASIGSSITVDDRTFLLASYHYAQSASKPVRDSHEMFAGVSRRIGSGRLLLTGFTTVGLSSGASAMSGGLGMSLGL